MKTFKYLIIVVGLMAISLGCRKKPLKMDTEISNTFNYISLEADSPIKPGTEHSVVTAVVEGDNLTYKWSVDPVGNLSGTGASIMFETCCEDNYLITCEVSDGVSTESKQVTVVVEL
jgi:hypothetical protein